MFNFIRTHNKTIQILLFLFILPGFFLFGIEGFNTMGEKSPTVAVVDGKKIGQLDWDAAAKDDVERIRQSAPNLDPKFFDSSEFKYASLERLVQKRVLATAAQKLRLDVSDQRLAAELLQNPVLAALRQPDGKIDEARYKELLAPQGLTPQAFEARVRSDLSIQQVQSSLAKSGIVPAALVDTALNAYFEKREVQVLTYSPPEFAKRVSPTPAEVEAFYKSHSALFQAAEKASIQYVVLDVQSIQKTITPSEADVKTYYEQNAQKLGGTEERRASHILMTVSKTASAEERQKAKKQAEDLLATVKKSPASFADVAKKYSQDTASAVNGGDLGFFARGAMTKSFEDAVFAMNAKQISDVVESEFGYHIIQLAEIKLPKVRSFAEMRPEIEADVQKQMAQKKFSEAAEIFTNTVYEQSDSLKPAADKLKLTIQTADNVTRQALPNQRGALANNKFLGALFGADSIDKKRNTEAIDVGGGQLVAGRVVSYTPAQTLPLAAVKDRAQALLTEQMGADLARKEGAAKFAELSAKREASIPDQLGAPMVISRNDTAQQQNPKLIEAVLKAKATQLPMWVGVDLGSEGYRLVRVTKIIEPGQTLTNQNREQFLQIWSTAESVSYYEYLKDKFNVQIKVPKPSLAAQAKSKST
ncbi:MAG: SurA N-terminal domain-containing protein [Cytophagales bacterium]|nr:SurA N-terminal domain-containing protein [Cytophagales bacterium]